MHTENRVDKIGAMLEYSPQRALRHLAQESGISKSAAAQK